MTIDKFIPPFIKFINKYFNNNHYFLFLHPFTNEYGLEINQYILWRNSRLDYLKLLKLMYKSEKIIIHGLWSDSLIKILLLQPWILKKCFWVMWGGDFYFPEKQSQRKKKLIKKIRHFVTYLKGDYEYVVQHYKARGKYHECLMYPSNLYKECSVKPKVDGTINIQLGNSATHTNNHFEVLERLVQYKDKNIKIFAPLSYGDQGYAEKVIQKGKELFGDKFIPLTEFMSLDRYLEFLGEIDVAIFAHNRQQGMGNIITLLGLGKKVYLRKDISPWQFFKSIGIKVFDIDDFNLDVIDEKTKEENRKKVKEYFSEENYLLQLKKLFDDGEVSI